jgi:diacylglycerol kinase family enzyme
LSETVVVVNAASGSGHTQEWAAALAEKFRALGVEARIVLAQSGEALSSATREALAAGATQVVAGGGDGTVSAVAGALVGTEVALGVLPLGTLNHFAKDLQLPLELDQAIATVAEGCTLRADVGEVTGRLFLNNSSIGLYPEIVAARERQQRQLGRAKWPAFVLAALGALRRFRRVRVRLTVNGRTDVRRTPFVFVGNNEYAIEGLKVGARSCLNAGRMCLFVARSTGRLGLFRHLLRALFGRLREAKDFDALSATELELRTRHRRVRVATDGEVTVMRSPLRYRIRPGALRVVVPRAAQGSDPSAPGEATLH